MSVSELSRVAGVSNDTAMRARAAQGLPTKTGYARDKALVDVNAQAAVSFLRSVLSLHPRPASDVEALAGGTARGVHSASMQRPAWPRG